MKLDKKKRNHFSRKELSDKRFNDWNLVVKDSTLTVQQEKQTYFLKWKEGVFLTILNRGIKKILLNKLFIFITVLTVLAFLASNLLGIYVLKPEKLDLKTICNTWIPFAILILYVTFFEIFSVHLLFYEDQHEGIVNLEIRSGFHKFKIFFERMLANKIIIWIILTFLILIQVIIGYTVKNLYLQTEIQKTLVGFLLIYLIDLAIFGLLLMLSTLKSSIPLSIIGTICGLFLAGSFVSNTMSINFLETKYNSESELTIQEKNNKYYFMSQMQNLIQKYGDDNSILGQAVNSFYQLRYLITDDHFNREIGFYTQNQIAMETYLPWHYLKKPYFSYDDYILELMANGLILFINQIPVFYRLEPNANPTNLEVNIKLMEENYIFKFLTSLTTFQSTKFGYSYQTAENSLFRGFNKNESKSNSIFSGDDGLFAFINRMSIDEEHKEIGQLIKNAAFYLYQDKYSNDPSDDFDSIAPTLEADLQVHIWKYNLQQSSEYNQMLLNQFFLDDGARTFTKIFFELLINFMNLSSPNYGVDDNNQAVQTKDYQSQVLLFSYLNPLTSLTRSFFELSGDGSFLNTNYLNGWCVKTYEIFDDKKSWTNVISFPNNQRFLRIALKQSYFNDSNYKEKNIMLKELSQLVTQNIQNYLPLIPELDFEFFVDFNKKIPVERTSTSYVVDLQVKEKNEEHFRGYLNIKLDFQLASMTDLPIQEEQYQQLLTAFAKPDSYEKYSKFFNQFINGKNYQLLKEDSINYHPYLPLIIIPLLGFFSICLGYWLFSKNLIK